MKLNWNYATKFIVSVLTSASAFLSTPGMGWKQAVVLGIGSILVWLVPNSNPTVVTTVKPTIPANPQLLPNERQELETLRAQKATQ